MLAAWWYLLRGKSQKSNVEGTTLFSSCLPHSPRVNSPQTSEIQQFLPPKSPTGERARSGVLNLRSRSRRRTSARSFRSITARPQPQDKGPDFQMWDGLAIRLPLALPRGRLAESIRELPEIVTGRGYNPAVRFRPLPSAGADVSLSGVLDVPRNQDPNIDRAILERC